MNRLVLTVALAVGFAAGLAISALPAHADSVTYVRVTPVQGSTAQAIELDLPDGAFCPAGADRVIARLEGGNLSSPLNVTGNTAIKALDTMSQPGTAVLPLLWTLQTTGGKVNPPLVLDGRFRLTVSCLAGLGQTSLGDSIADLTIDGSAGTYTVVTPQPAAAPASAGPEHSNGAASDESSSAEGPEKSVAQPETSQSGEAVTAQTPATSGRVGSGGAQRAQPETAQHAADVAGAPAGISSDEAALEALAASNGAPNATVDSGPSFVQLVLIVGGVLLLGIVVLSALRARRQP